MTFYTPISYDFEMIHYEFAEFVSKAFGKPYSYQQWAECSNGSTVSITVDPVYVNQSNLEFDEWNAIVYDPNEWEYEFQFYRKYGCDPEAIMYELVKRGLAEPGRYLLKMEW